MAAAFDWKPSSAISFQVFDTAVKARLVNRDIDHILADTDPNRDRISPDRQLRVVL